MSLTTKFRKDLQLIRQAASDEIFLDSRNPKLYKKIFKFYENSGVEFTGNDLDDYDIVIEQIRYDLQETPVK
tara:strand:- start:455 stop:670 length:216 start_codon:yes stop_codon:yes gene_type:complete